MKIKLKFEGVIEKWCLWILFICIWLLSLAPAAIAIIFAIFFNPWCLFLLTLYIFFGPIFVLAIHDCWEELRSF